jgi:CubicO group peptidase (beta-lactamase class C family)
VRRVSGRSLGRWFAEEIAAPLGLDLWIGFPPELAARRADIMPPDGGAPSIAELLGADSLTARVMNGPSGLFNYDTMWNRDDVLAAEMPSSNGVSTARALARLYAALIGAVDGRRVLRPETVARAVAVQSQGADRVLLLPTCFGLGYMRPPMLAPGCGAQSFGHTGAGGSLAFADPEAGISVAYVTTALQFDLTGDQRTQSLVRAIYASL